MAYEGDFIVIYIIGKSFIINFVPVCIMNRKLDVFLLIKTEFLSKQLNFYI